MTINPIALALLGLLCAAWTLACCWAILSARMEKKRAELALVKTRSLSRMLDEGPTLPMLVYADGRVDVPRRLKRWFGLSTLPETLSDLLENKQGTGGIPRAQLTEFSKHLELTRKTAQPFRMIIMSAGSQRHLEIRGHLADTQTFPTGAVQAWVFDFSESEQEMQSLRTELQRARKDFSALVALLEAAPMPMWFRGRDGHLQLVNSAYVAAVGGNSADEVVADGIELVEEVEGVSAAVVALMALKREGPVVRMVGATIGGERRSIKVSDLPLGDEGVAGYAIDVEDMEVLSREFQAYREAQRSMLDQLSAGVAQFDSRRRLIFANQPFQSIFGLSPKVMLDPPIFERFLDAAHDLGRVPEARDFPAWRRERMSWFAANSGADEAWSLPDGTHLRIVSQPMPDGGLVLVVEDRTEHLRLSAVRDTLLRTRTATFDSLFESLVVFAPDGRVQLWNRRFAADWGLPNAFMDTHPHIEELLERIAGQLLNPLHVKSVGDVVRAATLDRRQANGRVGLADGRTLEIAGVPLPDGNGLLTVLDITDSQKAQTALRERNAALEEADAIKTRFLANISYEFRTPLTSITGFAELLDAGLGGDLNDNGRDYTAAILTSVQRLGDQIESVLDLSQSEAGLLPLSRDSIELYPFITRLVQNREARIQELGIKVDVQGDKNIGILMGDSLRLGRALGHILDNALSAAGAVAHHRGRVLVEISRIRNERGVWARIMISDNGAGLDASARAQALGGVKVSADGKRIERRHGIGLPLARHLVEAHGGILELESEVGRGTVVLVDLP